METGSIGKWRKAVGDEIAPGDIICEVQTDKASVDFEATDPGFVAKILQLEGVVDLKVGEPIMIVVESRELVPKFADYKLAETGVSASASATPAPSAPAPAPVPPPAIAKSVQPAPAPVIAKVAPPVPASAPSPPKAQPKPVDAGTALYLRWGKGIETSALFAKLAQDQQKYIAVYGSTGQKPLEVKSTKKK